MNPSKESRPPIEIPPIPLAKVIQVARASNPSLHPIFVTVEEDEPHIDVGMADGLDPATARLHAFLLPCSSRPQQDKLLWLVRSLVYPTS